MPAEVPHYHPELPLKQKAFTMSHAKTANTEHVIPGKNLFRKGGGEHEHEKHHREHKGHDHHHGRHRHNHEEDDYDNHHHDHEENNNEVHVLNYKSSENLDLQDFEDDDDMPDLEEDDLSDSEEDHRHETICQCGGHHHHNRHEYDNTHEEDDDLPELELDSEEDHHDYEKHKSLSEQFESIIEEGNFKTNPEVKEWLTNENQDPLTESYTSLKKSILNAPITSGALKGCSDTHIAKEKLHLHGGIAGAQKRSLLEVISVWHSTKPEERIKEAEKIYQRAIALVAVYFKNYNEKFKELEENLWDADSEEDIAYALDEMGTTAVNTFNTMFPDKQILHTHNEHKDSHRNGHEGHTHEHRHNHEEGLTQEGRVSSMALIVMTKALTEGGNVELEEQLRKVSEMKMAGRIDLENRQSPEVEELNRTYTDDFARALKEYRTTAKDAGQIMDTEKVNKALQQALLKILDPTIDLGTGLVPDFMDKPIAKLKNTPEDKEGVSVLLARAMEILTRPDGEHFSPEDVVIQEYVQRLREEKGVTFFRLGTDENSPFHVHETPGKPAEVCSYHAQEADALLQRATRLIKEVITAPENTVEHAQPLPMADTMGVVIGLHVKRIQTLEQQEHNHRHHEEEKKLELDDRERHEITMLAVVTKAAGEESEEIDKVVSNEWTAWRDLTEKPTEAAQKYNKDQSELIKQALNDIRGQYLHVPKDKIVAALEALHHQPINQEEKYTFAKQFADKSFVVNENIINPETLSHTELVWIVTNALEIETRPVEKPRTEIEEKIVEAKNLLTEKHKIYFAHRTGDRDHKGAYHGTLVVTQDGKVVMDACPEHTAKSDAFLSKAGEQMQAQMNFHKENASLPLNNSPKISQAKLENKLTKLQQKPKPKIKTETTPGGFISPKKKPKDRKTYRQPEIKKPKRKPLEPELVKKEGTSLVFIDRETSGGHFLPIASTIVSDRLTADIVIPQGASSKQKTFPFNSEFSNIQLSDVGKIASNGSPIAVVIERPSFRPIPSSEQKTSAIVELSPEAPRTIAVAKPIEVRRPVSSLESMIKAANISDKGKLISARQKLQNILDMPNQKKSDSGKQIELHNDTYENAQAPQQKGTSLGILVNKIKKQKTVSFESKPAIRQVPVTAKQESLSISSISIEKVSSPVKITPVVTETATPKPRLVENPKGIPLEKIPREASSSAPSDAPAIAVKPNKNETTKTQISATTKQESSPKKGILATMSNYSKAGKTITPSSSTSIVDSTSPVIVPEQPVLRLVKSDEGILPKEAPSQASPSAPSNAPKVEVKPTEATIYLLKEQATTDTSYTLPSGAETTIDPNKATTRTIISKSSNKKVETETRTSSNLQGIASESKGPKKPQDTLNDHATEGVVNTKKIIVEETGKAVSKAFEEKEEKQITEEVNHQMEESTKSVEKQEEAQVAKGVTQTEKNEIKQAQNQEGTSTTAQEQESKGTVEKQEVVQVENDTIQTEKKIKNKETTSSVSEQAEDKETVVKTETGEYAKIREKTSVRSTGIGISSTTKNSEEEEIEEKATVQQSRREGEQEKGTTEKRQRTTVPQQQQKVIGNIPHMPNKTRRSKTTSGAMTAQLTLSDRRYLSMDPFGAKHELQKMLGQIPVAA